MDDTPHLPPRFDSTYKNSDAYGGLRLRSEASTAFKVINTCNAYGI
ncbi:MAG: hypothetical protein V7K43_07730 [Nostoc sp.]